MSPLDLKTLIAEVPDYPKPGISFKDLTPLLASPEGFREAVGRMAAHWGRQNVGVIVGAEARGFLWAAALADRIGVGVVPVRKPKKLPRTTIHATYQLEYGTDELHMHADALKPGQRVLIVDDVLATGGTAAAMVDLVKRGGGEVVGLAFVIELGFLKGREKLAGLPIQALAAY